MGVYSAIIAICVGLCASAYIYRKKKTKTKLICPLRANCDKVIHSTFSTTFGIPNELLGILYYTTLGALYALLFINPPAFTTAYIRYLIVLLTIAGVLFSVFLVMLQALVIRAWCSWCLLSAASNIVLGLCLFTVPSSAVIAIISAHKTIWLITHNIGFVLGVGAATVSDVLFFRFLKDFTITEEEKNTLKTLSGIVWVGLALLVISGLMLYLPAQARLLDSSKFLLKMIIVGVVVANGIALNVYVSPRLRRLSFDGGKPATRFRRIAFALGGISIVSWYGAFLLGSLRSIPVTVEKGLLVYCSLLFVTIIGSQIFERITAREYNHTPHSSTN